MRDGFTAHTPLFWQTDLVRFSRVRLLSVMEHLLRSYSCVAKEGRLTVVAGARANSAKTLDAKKLLTTTGCVYKCYVRLVKKMSTHICNAFMFKYVAEMHKRWFYAIK